MNQNENQQLFQEELFIQNNSATLFHRTRNIGNIQKILNKGWEPSRGIYGLGIYTTYILEDQLKPYMRGYGNILLKFKLENLNKYVFFSMELAKRIHKEDYLLKDQLKKIAPSFDFSEKNLEILNEIQKMAVTSDFSSDAAMEFYRNFKEEYKKIYGIEYYGRNDGHCILVLPPAKDLTLLAYSIFDKDEEEPNKIKWNKISSPKTFSTIFKTGLFSEPEIKLDLGDLENKKMYSSAFEYLRTLKNKNLIYFDDFKKLFDYKLNEKFIFNILKMLLTKIPSEFELSAIANIFKTKEYKYEILKYLYKINPQIVYSNLDNHTVFDGTLENLKFFLTLDKRQESLLKNSGGINFLRFIVIILSKNMNSENLNYFHQKVNEYNLLDALFFTAADSSFSSNIINNLYFKNKESIDSLVEDIKQLNLSEFTNSGKGSFVSKICDFLLRHVDSILNSEEKINSLHNLIAVLMSIDINKIIKRTDQIGNIANSYISKNVEKIPAELWPDIIENGDPYYSTVFEQIPAETLRKINVDKLTVALAENISKLEDSFKNSESYLKNVWNKMIEIPLPAKSFFEVYKNILENRDRTLGSQNNIEKNWGELFFNNFIIDISMIRQLVLIISRYFSYEDRQVMLNKIIDYSLKPSNFDSEIYIYLFFNTSYETAKLLIEKVEKLYPLFTQKAFTKNKIAPYITDGKNIHGRYILNLLPDLIKDLSLNEIKILMGRSFSSNIATRQEYGIFLKNLINSSVLSTNQVNDPMYIYILKYILIYSYEIYQSDPIKGFKEAVDFINSINPQIIIDKIQDSNFVDNLLTIPPVETRNFFINYIIENAGDKISSEIIKKIIPANKHSPAPDPLIFKKIFTAKNNKFNASELNTLIVFETDPPYSFSKYPKSPTPLEIINKYESINPEYVNMIDSYNWKSFLWDSDKNNIEKIIEKMMSSTTLLDDYIWAQAIRFSSNKTELIKKILNRISDKISLNSDLIYTVMTNTTDPGSIEDIIEKMNLDKTEYSGLVLVYNKYYNSQSIPQSAKKILYRHIFSNLNRLDDSHKEYFLNEMDGQLNANSKINYGYLKFAAGVRGLSFEMMKKLIRYTSTYYDLYDTLSFFKEGPQSLLTTLIRYNQREGYNIELFFDAIQDTDLKTEFNIDILKLVNLTADLLKSNLSDKVIATLLTTILQRYHTSDLVYEKFVKKILSPEYRGNNLTGALVGFILRESDEAETPKAFNQYLITTILKLTQEQITDNMAFSILEFAKDRSFYNNNEKMLPYVIDIIFRFRKNSLTASLLHNLLSRAYKLNDNYIKLMQVINNILNLKINNLSYDELRAVLAFTPFVYLESILNRLKFKYDKNKMQNILFSRYTSHEQQEEIKRMLL